MVYSEKLVIELEKRNSNKPEVPLTALKPGESGIVTIIRGGHIRRGRKRHGRIFHGPLIRGITRESGFEKRLMDMGLTPGTKVTVVRLAPFHGPFEILVRGSRLALGRGMAERIFVEIEK
jgi:ferrous iron transport protein A